MRIIAGQYKGRKLLPPPRGSRTRPITGAVKKSLFSMLEPHLGGAVVADLYCGTGTLGLEALSRGARVAYFAERDRAVVARLRRNIAAVGAGERAVIWPGDVEAGLAGRLSALGEPIDIAFIDPPYEHVRRWSWQRAEARIFAPLSGRLAADGIVILRAQVGTEIPDQLAGLAKIRVKSYGGMILGLFRPRAK